MVHAIDLIDCPFYERPSHNKGVTKGGMGLGGGDKMSPGNALILEVAEIFESLLAHVRAELGRDKVSNTAGDGSLDHGGLQTHYGVSGERDYRVVSRVGGGVQEGTSNDPDASFFNGIELSGLGGIGENADLFELAQLCNEFLGQGTPVGSRGSDDENRWGHYCQSRVMNSMGDVWEMRARIGLGRIIVSVPLIQIMVKMSSLMRVLRGWEC